MVAWGSCGVSGNDCDWIAWRRPQAALPTSTGRAAGQRGRRVPTHRAGRLCPSPLAHRVVEPLWQRRALRARSRV